MSNPLVAQQEENPDGPGPLTQGTGDAGWATGIGIAESVNDISNLEDGSSWVESGLAYGGAALEVVSLAVDPIGTLGSYGLSWLMEHVEPLNEALDWFAGDPDGVEAYGKTWANVSAATKEAAEHYARAVEADTADWVGQAGDAYRRHARENAEAINGAAELAGTISSVVTIMGEVVSFVRELVRDLVSECIAKLITYALEAIGTLGFGTPVVAVQATAFVSKTVTRIAEVAQKLIKTISNVSPKLGKMIEVFGTIIKKFGDMPDAFAEGAWKKFDDVFGTNVVGQHNARFGAPDGASPGGAPDSGDTSSPDGADASNAPDANDSGPTGSNDRPTTSGEPDGPDARPDDSGAETPEGSRTEPAQRPASPRGPDESSGPSPGPNESTAVPDPNGRTDSPTLGIRSDETPSTSPNSAGSRTPDEGTAVSTARDSSPGDSRTAPEDAPQVPRSPEDAPAGPRGEPQHAAAGSGPPDGSGGAAPGPASEAAAPSTTPDAPSSTTAADVSATTPPPPPAPQAPGTNAPSSSAAPSGPMGGVTGNPGTPGGTPSTTPRSPDRPSGGGWTGTAGTPGAAARPASTPDAPQNARPRGPESPPRTPVESPRANGPRTEQPGPDSVETHRERPPQHPRETGGAPADDAPDQPRDAEPGTPERRAQIEEAEATRQQTPAGSSYHDRPALNEHAQRVRDDGVHHTLDVHALPEGRFRIGDRTFSAEEVADMLRNDPSWDGRPIRLLSCDAGNSGLAAELADELGVPVTAPRGLVWTDSGGRVFASDIGPDGRPVWPPDGAWDTYDPAGSTTEVGNDGFHPPRDGEDPGARPEDAESRGDDEPNSGEENFAEQNRAAGENDFSELKQENDDLRKQGVEAVEELNQHDPNNASSRRPEERVLTTMRFRDDSTGEVSDSFNFSGKTTSHDWPPAKDAAHVPNNARLFQTSDAPGWDPDAGVPTDREWPRINDSEPKLMEELIRNQLAERSGLGPQQIETDIKKAIKEYGGRRSDYPDGLDGDIEFTRDRMDRAIELANERAAKRNPEHIPFSRDDISGDIRMVIDLPDSRNNSVPLERQVCDSCTDVLVTALEIFPNIRLEARNIQGDRLI